MSSKKKEPLFGGRIKEWRVRAGKTQAELDDAIGKRLGYTSQLEGGHIKKPPDRATCEEIARALAVSTDEVWRHAARARLKEFDPQLLEFHDDELVRAGGGSASGLSDEERALLDSCRQFGREAPTVTRALGRLLDASRAERARASTAFNETATRIMSLDAESVAGLTLVMDAVVGVFVHHRAKRRPGDP
jgi:transcriptional regulator with XRE-family HTH domain